MLFATPPRQLTGKKSSLIEHKSMYLQLLREMKQPRRIERLCVPENSKLVAVARSDLKSMLAYAAF